MSSGGPVHPDADADAILRRAARPERLWPIAVAVLCLYLAGSVWRFDRPFGDSGREAVLHATPTPWVPALVVAILVWARVAGRAEARAGGSPWRWPRVAKRTLTVLAVVLPVVCFGVAPTAAVLAADAGRTELGLPLTLVVDVGVDVR